MTDVNDILRDVQDRLDQAGIESARAEAATITAHVLDISRGELGVLLALGERLDSTAVQHITELTAARARRTPLQHLIGEMTFFGVDLNMSPGVFIPRPETEVLVDITLQRLARCPGPVKILDLCTGSGAIVAALADRLAARGTAAELWAIDLSERAVELAKSNVAAWDNVTVLCADATEPQAAMLIDEQLAQLVGDFDVVVSNPPYIPTTSLVTQPEARTDPELALYGGSPDGTRIPLAIAKAAGYWLAPDGLFMMEHDCSHASALSNALAKDPAWHSVQTLHDLTNIARFVSAVRTNHAQPMRKSS